MKERTSADVSFMRTALRLAHRAFGLTSPNPMVGAILVKNGSIIGGGWHHRAGEPHAEIEAVRDAQQRGNSPAGATLYVTLEPCCTYGRTPPCTDAILAAGIKRVVVGATDPNPLHGGKAFQILQRGRIAVTSGVLAAECERLNEAFNHWIVHGTPFVTVKAAMTMDGKIATVYGESKWITGEQARAYAMKLRWGADAILVGINTVLADDPSLTIRNLRSKVRDHQDKKLWRIILDANARTPLTSKVVSDEHAALTTIVVRKLAPKARVAALAKWVNVLAAPTFTPSSLPPRPSRLAPHPSPLVPPPSLLDIRWLLKRLGSENVTSLLVEGGGEVNASFLLGGLAQRIAFFYAPKIIGGRDARSAVAGQGVRTVDQGLKLTEIEWRKLGSDWLLNAQIIQP